MSDSEYSIKRPAHGTERVAADPGSSFFEMNLEAVVMVRRDRTIIDVNSAFAKLVGIERPALRDTNLYAYLHPEDRGAVDAEFFSLIRKQSVETFEARWTSGGTVRWLVWKAESTAEDLILLVAKDVTETRAATQTVDGALNYLVDKIHTIDTRTREFQGAYTRQRDDADATGTFEKDLAKTQKWWTRGIWVLGIVGAIFSAGMGYAVFVGALATTADVNESVDHALVEHNGGVHHQTINTDTLAPVGVHPDIRRALDTNNSEIGAVKDKVKTISESQERLDKRSEYQFEFSRWQADVTEAERRGRVGPAKPAHLEALERELMLGKY